MFQSLEPRDRLRLMKFVCSFAWADLEVRPQERAFVADLIRRLDIGEDEKRRVREWLEVPPPPESVDPSAIPRSHRELFLDAIRGVIASDGEIAPEESESLEILDALLA